MPSPMKVFKKTYLNRRNKNLNIPKPRNGEGYDEKKEYEENLEWEFTFKYKVLIDLMNEFEIDVSNKHSWFALAYELALLHVPAMKKAGLRGQPKKWTYEAHVKLYALYFLLTHNMPDISRKEIFNLMPYEIQKTNLKTVVKSDVSPSTLETRFDKFTNSKDFKDFEREFLSSKSNKLLSKRFKNLLEYK